MAEIVEPWPARPGAGCDHQVLAEPTEGVADSGVMERHAPIRDEEGLRSGDRLAEIPLSCVLAQDRDDGGMRRDQP